MVSRMWNWNDGTDYLMHHGIKGQKWGVRNYQYEDGSLTPEGMVRYGRFDAKQKLKNVQDKGLLVSLLSKYQKDFNNGKSYGQYNEQVRVNKINQKLNDNRNKIDSGFQYALNNRKEYLVPGYSARYLYNSLSKEDLENLKMLMAYVLTDIEIYNDVHGPYGAVSSNDPRNVLKEQDSAMLVQFVKEHDQFAKKAQIKKLEKTKKAEIN